MLHCQWRRCVVYYILCLVHVLSGSHSLDDFDSQCRAIFVPGMYIACKESCTSKVILPHVCFLQLFE
jgi:hypothetical protein